MNEEWRHFTKYLFCTEGLWYLPHYLSDSCVNEKIEIASQINKLSYQRKYWAQVGTFNIIVKFLQSTTRAFCTWKLQNWFKGVSKLPNCLCLNQSKICMWVLSKWKWISDSRTNVPWPTDRVTFAFHYRPWILWKGRVN